MGHWEPSGGNGRLDEPFCSLHGSMTFREFYHDLFFRPYALEAKRAIRSERDRLLLLLGPELLGIPHPLHPLALELLPELLAQYHEWHRRAGYEHAPEGGWRCC